MERGESKGKRKGKSKRERETESSRIVGIKKEREKEEKVCFRSGSNQRPLDLQSNAATS